MPIPAEQPRFDQPVVDQTGRVTRPWADYFLRMASAQTSDDLRALYEALAARVAELEDGGQLNFRILGQQSVEVNGVVQPNGVVVISLIGDSDAPGNTTYYGTGPDGTKGWFPVAGAISVSSGELTKAVGTDGVVTLGLADVADSGAGTLLAVTRDGKGRVTGTKAATITGTAQQIDVANGDAAAGLPTLSLAPEVLDSLDLADSAVQEVVAGAGIDVDNTDPRRPIVSAEPVTPGVPEAPLDGWPYARGAAAWQSLDGPSSPYVLLKLPVLTDQAGNVLTDQQGRVLTANVPAIPYAWLTGVPTYRFPPMTLAQANALSPVLDGQPVLITDLSGGREPCWYDETVASGTKWRRFSDRSIAN